MSWGSGMGQMGGISWKIMSVSQDDNNLQSVLALSLANLLRFQELTYDLNCHGSFGNFLKGNIWTSRLSDFVKDPHLKYFEVCTLLRPKRYRLIKYPKNKGSRVDSLLLIDWNSNVGRSKIKQEELSSLEFEKCEMRRHDAQGIKYKQCLRS
jgi:hypothetical protein